MDPSSYSIFHGPEPSRRARSTEPAPSFYDERNIRLLSEYTGLDEGTLMLGGTMLGAISYGLGRGRGPGQPCGNSLKPSRRRRLNLSFDIPVRGGRGLTFTGYTYHGLNQRITRGISSREVLQAVRNPRNRPRFQRAQETYQFTGKNNVTINLNEAGELVTTYRGRSR